MRARKNNDDDGARGWCSDDEEDARARALAGSNTGIKERGKWWESCLCCRPAAIQLCEKSDVPTWMQRQFILGSYRPDLTFWQSCHSVLWCHNESGNIWSHIVGGMMALWLALWYDPTKSNGDPFLRPYALELLPYEGIIFQIYLFAAAGCLLTSAVYHTGNCTQDEGHCALLLRADASGVATLIAASFLPAVYAGFACFPEMRYTYLWVCMGLLVVGLAVSLADSCSGLAPAAAASADVASSKDTSTIAVEESRGMSMDLDAGAGSAPGGVQAPSAASKLIPRLRTATFSSQVVLGACGVAQWASLVSPLVRSSFLPKFVFSLGFYFLGFGFYASAWPERRWPGSFDLAFHR